MATLYITATPIGNLEDITYRAVRVLSQVDVIACEDTRHTRILLDRYNITGKRLIACHARNEDNSSDGIIKLLEEGLDIAYVSDAGTPGINDPGGKVVSAARKAGFEVVPVPGPSAVATLVSVAGFTGKSFTFEGFLSPKPGRRRSRLAQLLDRDETFIVYESPYRVARLLADIADLAPQRQLTVGREMTKAFEQFICGTASEVLSALTQPKGEFAVLVHPSAAAEPDEED